MVRRIVIAAALAAAGSGVVPVHAATQTVTAQGTSFFTIYVTPVTSAAKGDTIKFVNNDLTGIAPHTLTFDNPAKLCTDGITSVPCDTGTVAQGGSRSITLSAAIPAGQYQIHCNVHATMHGVLNVS